MKRIISIFMTVMMLVSCTVILGTGANAAATPTVTDVNNYTVTIDGITDIKEIRYAIGHFTKGDQIRNAEKNQTLSASLVNSYTTNGVMTYEVPWTGEYTFWVRYNDGTNHFLYCDVKDIEPYIESDGLRLTVKDFGENYKDMWIAEGTWNSYSEIKNNVAASAKYQAAAAKLSNYFANHDFTYTTANPGKHTVLIRYNDGTQDVLHVDLTVDVPTFTQYGLQLTVGNIPGVKIIRCAYGHYANVTEIKKAPLLRCFNNKTAIKDAESYKIQYREAGEVTVIVEYATGYKHVEYINIEPKTSTMTQDGNKITIGDIDTGFMMVRYAPGTWKTSNGVKNAEGSKYLKSEAINENGVIVIKDLAIGDWTFCVQYDDESFNYYYVDVTEINVGDPELPDEPEVPEITVPTFTVDSLKAKAGETVEVKIAVAKNPGLASIGMQVAFDEALTLNSVIYNSDIGGMSYQPQEFETPVKLVWVSPYEDVEGDFTFVTLSFTVPAGTAAGTYPVGISYNADDVYDMTENNIAFEVINGVITVVK